MNNLDFYNKVRSVPAVCETVLKTGGNTDE